MKKLIAMFMVVSMLLNIVGILPNASDMGVQASAEKNVSADFTSGSFVGENMTHTVNNNAETNGAEYVTVDGVCGLHLLSYKYIYFKVINDAVTVDDNELFVEITYYDEGTSSFRVEYNSTESNYAKAYISKTGTNEWKTITLKLEDAAFAHKQNNGGDFRIVAPGSEGVTISKIVIKKQFDISGDFTSGSYVGNNLDVTANHTNTAADSYTSFVTIDGVTGINIPKGNYAYCRVTSGLITEDDKKLTIDITYYDNSSSGLFVQYNSDDGSNYTRITAPGEETNRWRTVTIYIDDAYFHRGQNYASDFRISSSGGVKISKIVVKRHNLDPDSEPKVKLNRDTEASEFQGKSFVGYQGWYGIGGQYSSWNHYAHGTADEDGTSWPRADHISIDYFPNVSEFPENSVAQTGFANLGSGEATKLYKSNTEEVFDTHFSWMKEYGIDGAAVQRFVGGVHTMLQDDTKDNFYSRIMRAAENNDRLVYLMYDLSGGVEVSDETDTTTISQYVNKIKFDWVYNIEKHQKLTSSTAYATVDGKPVVCIFGLGISSRPGRMVDYMELINFFHERGCYVIVSTDRGWRTQDEFIEAYNAADMINPWLVGATGSYAGVENLYDGLLLNDVTYCRENGLDYYPVVYSGFSWALWAQGKPNAIPRDAGQFFWTQAYKVKETLGLDSFFIAVFDEFDEGTAIAKNASDYFDIPTDQYFVTASCDGYWLSSDFQLRTVGAAIAMAKGETELVSENPVAHSLGPIYYRNSFEKRYLNAAETKYSGVYPIDPCFKNEGMISVDGVTATVTDDTNSIAKTGEYVAEISGTATKDNALYIYRISETAIEIKPAMKLSYSVYAENELGKNTYIELICSDGTRVTSRNITADGVNMGKGCPKGMVGSWTDYEFTFGTNSLVGKEITSIALCYSGDAGDFTAYYDNVIIEDGEDSGDLDDGYVDVPGVDETIYENSVIYANKATLGNAVGGTAPNINTSGNYIEWTGREGAYFTFDNIPAGNTGKVELTIHYGTLWDNVKAYITANSETPYLLYSDKTNNGVEHATIDIAQTGSWTPGAYTETIVISGLNAESRDNFLTFTSNLSNYNVDYIVVKGVYEDIPEEPSTEEPSTEEPSTEEPSTEEPSTEETSTEEASTEEPSIEEASTEEPSTAETETEPSYEGIVIYAKDAELGSATGGKAPNINTSGKYIEWTSHEGGYFKFNNILAGNTGKIKLTIHYGTIRDNVEAYVAVNSDTPYILYSDKTNNGVPHTTIKVAKSGSWTPGAYTDTVEISGLNAASSNNSLTFSSNRLDYNVDYIIVEAINEESGEISTEATTEATTEAPSTGKCPTVHIEAEDFVSQKGVEIASKIYEGSQFINSIGNGDTVSYNVDMLGTGKYTVALRASTTYTGNRAVEVYVDGEYKATVKITSTGAWATFKTFESEEIYLIKGNHSVTLKAVGGGYNINWLEFVGNETEDETQAGDDKDVTIRIEAEDYDSMSGVALRGTYDQGTDVLKSVDKGDYMVYTVDVEVSGKYIFKVRAARPDTNASVLSLRENGSIISSINVTGTGSWNTFAEFEGTEMTLTAGQHTFTVYADGGRYNLNWYELVHEAESGSETTTEAPTKATTEAAVTGENIHIEAEDFVSQSGVALRGTYDQGTDVLKSVDAGDYMVYAVNVPVSGTYRFDVRAARQDAGSSLLSFMENDVVIATVSIAKTGSWSTFKEFAGTEVYLTAGQHTFKVYANGGRYNLNWYELTRVSAD